MIDIYTGKAITKVSREHIIPDFLGGRLQPADLIDESTNKVFGFGIDAGLERALRPFRLLVDGRSRRRPETRAQPMKRVTGDDGQCYNVGAGGIVTRPPRVRIRRDGDRLLIEGHAPDRATVEKLVSRYARRKGLDVARIRTAIRENAREHRVAPPVMSFPLSLWDRFPYRATAKIACNLFASRHRDAFLRHEFDEIRRFVLRGERAAAPVQAVNVDIGSEGMGQFDHFVSVETFPDGNVLGLVVYFGVLAFVIRLGILPTAPAGKFCYRVDQLGRQERVDAPADLRIPIPDFDQAADREHEEFARVVESQVRVLLPRVLSVQRDRWIARVLARHLKNAHRTKQDRAELAVAISDDLVRDLAPRWKRMARQRQGASE